MLGGKITIALAGLGSRGKDTYAQAVKKFPEKMEIVAIADIDPDKVKEVAEEFHIISAVFMTGSRFGAVIRRSNVVRTSFPT